MDGTAQRSALAALVAAHGESYAALSRMLGRNAAYLQQFVARGSPRRLAEVDRGRLARYFGVPESALGGPETADGLVAVPRLDVGAAAGAGRLVEREPRRRPGAFDAALLRQLGLRPAAASVIRVAGDSMAPLLLDGDEILVDSDRRTPDARGGLFVLRLDGAIAVKRVRSLGRDFEVTSENPAYPPPRLVASTAADVIGRVVWVGRALL